MCCYWIHSSLWTSKTLLTAIVILPGVFTRQMDIFLLFGFGGNRVAAFFVIFAGFLVCHPNKQAFCSFGPILRLMPTLAA